MSGSLAQVASSYNESKISEVPSEGSIQYENIEQEEVYLHDSSVETTLFNQICALSNPKYPNLSVFEFEED